MLERWAGKRILNKPPFTERKVADEEAVLNFFSRYEMSFKHQ